MDPGVMAAIRLLPRHKKEIEELALADESFRGLCRDLADATDILLRLKESVSADAAERWLEYRHLVDGLEAELQRAIQEKRVPK